MRRAKVFYNGELAGELTERERNDYCFEYNQTYLNDSVKPAISLTLPKNKNAYHAQNLFPFFSNLLSEGVNRKLQCVKLKIDENDDFGLLLATAGIDTIGAVTIGAVTIEAVSEEY